MGKQIKERKKQEQLIFDTLNNQCHIILEKKLQRKTNADFTLLASRIVQLSDNIIDFVRSLRGKSLKKKIGENKGQEKHPPPFFPLSPFSLSY